ncbi:MAG: NADH:flavin oxidoreductase/NADH oxidase [Gemmatimonadetes bacterium]|nr:NADH:flavin oxidoreductase/NADH oxidase [Gemmatimonadota bacterium]
MPSLFAPLDLRGLTIKNRIVVSPMCQYSAVHGVASDWHLVHLGSRAVGGAGLVIAEATAVVPEGRISPEDLGLWTDDQIEPLARITRFVRDQGAAIGIQLAHAGRKASSYRPWSPVQGEVPRSAGGWETVAPSAIRYGDGYPMPAMLDEAGISAAIAAFAAAATRAVSAGFQLIELHAAHGYLLHEFLSPTSNHRTDRWGGSFEGRIRLVLEVVRAVRAAMPDAMPLWIRISATDWSPDGWTIEESVELARRLGPLGVDLVDCSSGGNVTGARIPVGPGYQTPFAERIRREAQIATGTVGFVTAPEQADQIVRTGQADVVLLARELLRDPYWPLRAAVKLGQVPAVPPQYRRAW